MLKYLITTAGLAAGASAYETWHMGSSAYTCHGIAVHLSLLLLYYIMEFCWTSTVQSREDRVVDPEAVLGTHRQSTCNLKTTLASSPLQVELPVSFAVVCVITNVLAYTGIYIVITTDLGSSSVMWLTNANACLGISVHLLLALSHSLEAAVVLSGEKVVECELGSEL